MRRLLIANRGEIARRVIRTAHRLGIETVAVHSDADARALHVREATHSHALGGDVSADTYLRIDKLIDAARVTGADAVHPGYGFLSENAAFAQAVLDAGLVWVGPSPEAMRALGSKSRAKELARARGVPCLPGYLGEVQSLEHFTVEAQRIGYPVMVKATKGGGGRGMRLVADASQLAEALASARSEALSAFGSGELLLERALLAPRHVEVQVFADAHGNCIHLGERDCSVQRRHQKLVEEAPSPAVDDELRARMTRCAVELAKSAGYVGAGTVEFLVEIGEFFLMEMNTRLQVEHPVTEALTGLDLVEWQIRVARGEPLPLRQEQVVFKGHAIEVRLCAEDESFVPHAGRVARFREPGVVRFDHAIDDGMEVPPHYDSMLGKLVAHAATRTEAIEQLAAALDRTVLLGLPNNRRLLAAVLRHRIFREGEALIPFLHEQGDAIRGGLAAQESLVLQACATVAIYPDGAALALANPFTRPARVRHRGEVHGQALRASEVGTTRAEAVGVGGSRWHARLGAVDLFLEDATFDPPVSGPGGIPASELRAPFNGKVIAVKTQPGARVARGETLLVIESMKLEHTLSATRDAVIKTIHVQAGQQAATSQVLVSFEAAA